MNTIALLTDFGLVDGYVGAMKGVISSINPTARIIDISHDSAPQHVHQASYILWSVYKYFPPGTLFAVIVDPGVGSDRRIILVEDERKMKFLYPENGVLSFILPELKNAKFYHINNDKYWIKPVSHTFHGRDIFSPVAAHISSGVPPEKLGVEIDMEIRESPFVNLFGRTDREVIGKIVHVDRFGNLITSLKPATDNLNGLKECSVELGGHVISSIKKTYSGSRRGELIALIGSSGLIEISIRNSSAQQMLGLRVGDPVILSK